MSPNLTTPEAFSFGAVMVAVVMGLFKVIYMILTSKLGSANLSTKEVKDLMYKADLKKVVESMDGILVRLMDKGDARDKEIEAIKVKTDVTQETVKNIAYNIRKWKELA